MITPMLIPVTVSYKVRGVLLQYRISVKDGWYYWEASGNSGKELTRTMAETAARRWLRGGQ